MMGKEIFKIDTSWAEKLTKTRVQEKVLVGAFSVIVKLKTSFPALSPTPHQSGVCMSGAGRCHNSSLAHADGEM